MEHGIEKGQIYKNSKGRKFIVIDVIEDEIHFQELHLLNTKILDSKLFLDILTLV
jgi:hypothetical protein